MESTSVGQHLITGSQVAQKDLSDDVTDNFEAELCSKEPNNMLEDLVKVEVVANNFHFAVMFVQWRSSSTMESTSVRHL